MSVESPTRFVIPLLLLVIAALAAISYYENYRINKIEIMIRDNGRDNFANLPAVEMTDFLEGCGARVDSSGADWIVEYDGLLLDQTWKFMYAPPAPGRR